MPQHSPRSGNEEPLHRRGRLVFKQGGDGSFGAAESNVDRTRRLIAAYNARDIDGLVALCDPEVHFRSALTAVDGATYTGHDGIRAWSEDVADAWGHETRVQPESYYDLGERTLTFHLLHGEGLQSGVRVAMPVGLIIRWRNGLAVEVTAYANRGRALSELGVTEDSLNAIAP